jgi:transcriptional regulator with XRE-family HTH domain
MADIADKKALGTRIKALRKVRHWTQKELAHRLGIRFEQLNKYESGLNIPPVEMLVKLAEALETSVDYLLTGTHEESTLANARLFRRFQALEHLHEDDQQTVIRVIDAMIAQQRVHKALNPVDLDAA